MKWIHFSEEKIKPLHLHNERNATQRIPLKMKHRMLHFNRCIKVKCTHVNGTCVCFQFQWVAILSRANIQKQWHREWVANVVGAFKELTTAIVLFSRKMRSKHFDYVCILCYIRLCWNTKVKCGVFCDFWLSVRIDRLESKVTDYGSNEDKIFVCEQRISEWMAPAKWIEKKTCVFDC